MKGVKNAMGKPTGKCGVKRAIVIKGVISKAETLGCGTSSAGVWSSLGAGYCFGRIGTEKSYRIGGWIKGGLSAAKSACEANAACVGVHFDNKLPDFVLLTKVGTPNGQDRGRRSCYKYNR